MKKVLLLKAHVSAYTKKDGTFVAAHEDKRVSAKLKAPAPHEVYGILADAEDSGGKAAVLARAKEIMAAHPELIGAVRTNYSDLGYSLSDLGVESSPNGGSRAQNEDVDAKQVAVASSLWDAESESILEKIKQHLEDDDDFMDFGLRVIPKGHRADVGDVLAQSKHWVDGEDTGEEIGGTSTIGVSAKNIRYAMIMLERSGYQGDQVVLVRGERNGPGEDEGEMIIKDAEVVDSWDRSPLAKSMRRVMLVKAGAALL